MSSKWHGRGDPSGEDMTKPNAVREERGEWFAPIDPRTGEEGLRFGCSMCGNCCSGPEGYVLVTEAECGALAERLGMDVEVFKNTHTHLMMHGRSLNEKVVDGAHDCIFLDRTTIPGKAVCGVYEDRPIQCKTWPFWPSLIRERVTWERAKRICPGIDKGNLVPIEQIRIQRDACRI